VSTADPPAFQATVAALVGAVAHRAGSFNDLVERLPGVWPPLAQAALVQLAATGRLDPVTHNRLMPGSGSASRMFTGGSTRAHEILLPLPHPLDYDWRFSEQTVSGLLAHCLDLTQPGDTVVLLGTPTLLRAALEQRAPRRFVLLDRAKATVNRLAGVAPRGTVIACDLGTDPLPKLSARVVVADPPWYPAHVRAFLWAAARLAAPGAHVLLSEPALGTRPGVLVDQAAGRAFAERVGLIPIAHHPGGLQYVSPQFERRALEAVGLTSVSWTWRQSDLVEFRRTSASVARRPDPPDETAWTEVQIGPSRLRFLAQPPADPATADPRLIELIPGGVLPTVSSRDPVRTMAAVWTVMNRVYGCSAPLLAASIAAALENGTDPALTAARQLRRPLTPEELSRVADAAEQLAALARLEMRDTSSGYDRDNGYPRYKHDRLRAT
jgi:hypothetical protein